MNDKLFAKNLYRAWIKECLEDEKKMGLPHIQLKEFEERVENIEKNGDLKTMMVELEGWIDLPAHLLKELFELVGAMPLCAIRKNNISKTDWERERKQIIQYRDEGCTDSGKYIDRTGGCICSRCGETVASQECKNSIYCYQCQLDDSVKKERYEREDLNDHYISTRGFN